MAPGRKRLRAPKRRRGGFEAAELLTLGLVYEENLRFGGIQPGSKR